MARQGLTAFEVTDVFRDHLGATVSKDRGMEEGCTVSSCMAPSTSALLLPSDSGLLTSDDHGDGYS